MQLLRLVADPAGSAEIAGQQVLNATARSITGAETGQLMSTADTIGNIDQILSEHGETMTDDSRRSLVDLRDSMKERRATEGADPGTPVNERPMVKSSELGRNDRVDPDFDRFADADDLRGDDLHDAINLKDAAYRTMHSKLRVLPPRADHDPLRSRDPWRFTIPCASAFTEEGGDIPIFHLRGDDVHLAPGTRWR